MPPPQHLSKPNVFSVNAIDKIHEFPHIDILLLTHDHFDHLDLDSIKKVKEKVSNYYVALGCARHLVEWGIPENNIQEFDWWDSTNRDGLNITYTPSRHFSGRELTNRSTSLWGGWVLTTESENIYFSGDGGYGKHFKEVGEKLGPFDIGIMECGQYNENWHQIHMYPEESVQAGLDAGAKVMVPVHWGGFALAQHHWKDPINRFKREGLLKGVEIQTPRLGEVFSYKYFQRNSWWDSFE